MTPDSTKPTKAVLASPKDEAVLVKVSRGTCARGLWGTEMEVSSDAEHFHVHAQEHKVLQFSHRHRPLAAITRVQVLSDHRLAQVELARRGLSWG
ncbi:Grifin, partial [Eschrichtius robustus]|nr:Grifin [Eschrichtius robustus]